MVFPRPATSSFSLVLRLTVLLLLFTLWIPLHALAKVDTGAILGTVRDQSGAVIPGAAVTLKNERTGLVLTTKTDSSGNYIFTPIQIGAYAVEAGFQGFQKVNHVHIPVQVQQQVVVNFVLPPGQVTQTIQVTAAPPQLQTENASVGQVIGARQINDLPLNGRNYPFLAQLAAGTDFSNERAGGRKSVGDIGKFTSAINGNPNQNA